MNLKDKVVIVTGSARALGKAYALRFAQEGAKVVVCDILDCEETVKEIESGGGEVLSLWTDVSREESTIEMAKKTVAQFGRIDVLVNNAAVYANIVRKPFYEISVDEWDKLMAVNLRGMFLCCKAVFPFMKAQREGKIINIASSTAFSGGNALAHYVTSKGGVISFTRAMARELGEYNISINAVAPGLTLTESNIATVPKHVIEASLARRSLKRQQRPEDLLGVVMFLASEESDFITGQTIVVDGGSILH